MKILITGGAGLVGSHCAEFFAKVNKKNKIIVLDNLMRSQIFGYDKASVEYNWNYLKKFKNIERIKGDVRNDKDVSRAIGKGVDAVVHTAGQPGVPSSVRIPKEDFSINAYGTLNILEAARKKAKDTIIVYCSCFDEETKAVTIDGIKRYNEIKVGDEVLSINPKTGKIEIKPVEEVIVQKYKGPMIYFKGKRYNFLVTPNHRILYQHNGGNFPSNFEFKSASEMTKRSQFFLPNGQYEGRNDECVGLLEKAGNPELHWNVKNKTPFIKTEDLFYLLGIYIGDGSLNLVTKNLPAKSGLSAKEYIKIARDPCNGRFISINNPKDKLKRTSLGHGIFFDIPENDKYRGKVENILRRNNIIYHTYKNIKNGQSRVYVGSKILFNIFGQCGHQAKEKRIPRWILDYSPEYLKYLLQGILDSDGNGINAISTVSNFLIRGLIELCVKSGYSASFKEEYSKSFIQGRKIEGKSYNFHVSKVPRRAFKKNISWVNYDGIIWCLKVKDNENFLIEREGKIVFSGNTNKVYGENVDKIPLRELETRYVFDGVNGVSEDMCTDLTGHTPYGVSKLVGDLYVQEYSHIYKMKTGVFRMSCTYGTRQFGFEDQGWVAWFIIAALFNKQIRIYGNGKQVRDMLYVDDLVDAFNRFINSNLKRGLFNIGGGPHNTISLLEFLDQLEVLTGKRPEVKFAAWRPSDQKVYISDTTKLEKALGWKTKISVKEGIKKLLDWIKENESYFS
jgi:nucleoside-diphosphate-sugar epimerase